MKKFWFMWDCGKLDIMQGMNVMQAFTRLGCAGQDFAKLKSYGEVETNVENEDG